MSSCDMDCVQWDPLSKTVQMKKIEVPKLERDDDVLIKVGYSGICETDVEIIRGDYECSERPLTLGHEFGGTVADFGSAVTHLQKGDRVVCDPNRDCGQCDYCKKGQYHLCPHEGIYDMVGLQEHGCWAQYCRVPAKQVHVIPKDMPLWFTPLCEPLSCVLHGWNRIGTTTSKDARIGIIEADIIGNLWITVLHQFGFKHVTVIEINPNRRITVESLETGYDVIHPDQVKERKFDLVID